jgi:hypothetical protein
MSRKPLVRVSHSGRAGMIYHQIGDEAREVYPGPDKPSQRECSSYGRDIPKAQAESEGYRACRRCKP